MPHPDAPKNHYFAPKPPAASSSSSPATLAAPEADPWKVVPARAQHNGRNTSTRHQRRTNTQPCTNDSEEVNENISERFTQTSSSHQSTILTHRAKDGRFLNVVSDYVKAAAAPVQSDALWRHLPEFPSTKEICPALSPHNAVESPLPLNVIDEPWESREDYLSTQYLLLREDSLRPLRDAVAAVAQNPDLTESQFSHSVGIYEKLYPVAVTYAKSRGVAIRFVFSLGRVGKKIVWAQSKRLISGSLVALTPASDMFRTKCIVAMIAARPLQQLETNPPTVDIVFPREDEMLIDPAEELVMVEERSAYYEANRHTMLALQKLMREPFPLEEHLVHLQKDVEPPEYLQRNPFTRLNNVVDVEAHQQDDFENVDLLKAWPEQQIAGMDASQQDALRRMLCQRVAIIQGPPGTGKTFVSVVALRIMMDQLVRGDPPIIVGCQTNHALDQILRKVAEFAENDFIRLGGRSTDKDRIKRRTLYEVRKATPLPHGPRGPMKQTWNLAEQKLKSLLAVFEPKPEGHQAFDSAVLKDLGLITPDQYTTLIRGCIKYDYAYDTESMSRLDWWLGKKKVEVTPATERTDKAVLDYEEIDLETEQVQEREAEFCAKDDEDDIDALKGTTQTITENISGTIAPDFTDEQTRTLLQKNSDIWNIPTKYRGSVYNYLLKEAKKRIFGDFRRAAVEYNRLSIEQKTANWERDLVHLKQQKLIGVTTTGLSKYRALISSLHPRVLLVEEAAETLEAPVTSGLVESLQQLILVGDHKQLRPHCNVRELERREYSLNISLFERLVNNDLELSILRMQRRMIPEIRRILKPIYGNNLITDHPSVKDPDVRPPVPGMGDCNLYWLHHQWQESRDELQSCQNIWEADYITNFCHYLVQNCTAPEMITVLTFYNAQRKLINRKLHRRLPGAAFKIVTVDSYQGEENDIIILSLVRSNIHNSIGFLSVENRVCVALSRARRGFYLFGDGELLASEDWLWGQIIDHLDPSTSRSPSSGHPRRIGETMPLYCEKHSRKTFIKSMEDWESLSGGCQKDCRGMLQCGHPCSLKCHPFPHEDVQCSKQCQKELECGHRCERMCGEECRCEDCPPPKPERKIAASSHVRQDSDPSTWQQFARGGAYKHDSDLSQVASVQRKENLHRTVQITPQKQRGGRRSRAGSRTGAHTGSPASQNAATQRRRFVDEWDIGPAVPGRGMAGLKIEETEDLINFD